MPTNNIENKLEKEPPKEPEPENIDVELNRIEAEAEKTKVDNQEGEAHHPHFVTPQPAAYSEYKPKGSVKERLRRLLRSKKFWITIVLLLLVAAAALWFVDPARWWALNTAGQRTNLTIHTLAPGEGKQKAAKLKNAQVTINGKQYNSDQNGEVTVSDQPYGAVNITASKRGYADATHSGVLDFDPFLYAFGGKEADDATRNVELKLKAIGVPVAFKAVDYLSGMPITDGEYTVGDLTVKPDDQGVVAFKAPVEDEDKVKVTSNFAGKYIDKSFDIVLKSDEPTIVTFVPAGKHYFMSKRDGSLSIYGSNVDGSDTQQIIPGTGKEDAATAFTVSPSGKFGVLASTRDGVRNDKNVLLHRIYVIDLEKKQMTKVDEAPYFDIADWAGDKLVYSVTDGAQPSKLRSVDVDTKKLTDLATAQSFGRKVVSFDQVAFVQYNVSATETKANFRLADLKTGAVKDLVQDILGYNVVQPDFDRVAVATLTDQKWQEYNFNTGQLKPTAQPAEQATQVFLGNASPDGTKRLLIDRIDGKFTLITKNSADGAKKQLYGAGGLGGPVRWIQNEVIVFRVVTDRETADYAISTKGGEPKKISDVTAAASTQGAALDPNLFRYY